MEAALPWVIALASAAYIVFITREVRLVRRARPKGRHARDREAWRRGLRMSIGGTAFLLAVGIPLTVLGVIPFAYVALAIPVVIALQLLAGMYAQWWAQAFASRR